MSLTIELIVNHHRRRRARPPYSATAYLVDTALTPPLDLVGTGQCDEAGSEGEAARDALRDLQQKREHLAGAHDALLVQALLSPMGAITQRRTVG